MGILAVAKPMIQSVFADAMPALVTTAFASAYLMSLAAGNLGGRLGWAAISDKIGRRNTFHIYTLGAIPLFGSLPFLINQCVSNPEGPLAQVYLTAFCASTVAAISILGGTFAVLPAYEADLYGPKYFVLVLDDYNQNRSNMGLVSTGNHITKLAIPSYTDAANESCSGELGDTTYVETAPRRLTKSQLYTINQIIEDRAAGETRARAPNPSDVLAVIPLRNVTTTRPQPISEVNTAIRSSIREYFGPVSIARLRVRLLDDRGYPVDLHGADWSLLMTATQLYQY